MTLRRSKQYVAILIGGVPVGIDKIIEQVATHKRHLNFVHGMNVFVLYFYSRKSARELRRIFNIHLHQHVDLILLFRFHSYMAHHVSPRIQYEMIQADMSRKNVIGDDIQTLREIIGAHIQHVSRLAPNAPLPQAPPPDEMPPEEPLDERGILSKILDKIGEQGYAALTPGERDFLQSYSNKLKKNNQNQG